jgi:antitoxin VapB
MVRLPLFLLRIDPDQMQIRRNNMNPITAKVFKVGNSKALRLPRSLNIKTMAYQVTPTATGFVLTDPAAEANQLKALKALRGSSPDFPNHRE